MHVVYITSYIFFNCKDGDEQEGIDSTSFEVTGTTGNIDTVVQNGGSDTIFYSATHRGDLGDQELLRKWAERMSAQSKGVMTGTGQVFARSADISRHQAVVLKTLAENGLNVSLVPVCELGTDAYESVTAVFNGFCMSHDDVKRQ